MAESTRLVDLVQSRIDSFLDERAIDLTRISSDLDLITQISRQLLSGGKRFRALFCYWGWQSISGLERSPDPIDVSVDTAAIEPVISACTALEVFHAAALVHDDIMDNSDTRRGFPATHRLFETAHRDRGFDGSADAFGRSSALLLGDLLLGWSDELLDSGLRELESVAAAAQGRTEFNRMRTEVTLGQYLDILEENSWRTQPENQQLPRAHRVVVYKSAKYSVEAPLVIGAAIAGADEHQVSALRDFGLPLGVAFQLRDDLLGVFGDPAVTGKPAGDDLREGKRTVLIALARPKLPGSIRQLLDELLGDPELDNQQIAMLQTAIRDSGAVEHVERVIDHNVATAMGAIRDAPLAASAREQLTQLADTVTRRVA